MPPPAPAPRAASRLAEALIAARRAGRVVAGAMAAVAGEPGPAAGHDAAGGPRR